MNLISNYMLFLQTDKNSSLNTVESYTRDLKGFFSFEKTPSNVLEIEPQHIRAYIAHLDNLGRARSSINRMLIALKGFFDYLVEIENVIKSSPAAAIKCGKKEKSLPKAISQEDVFSIITASDKRLKDRVIIELLYGLGGRVSEVASLKVEDISFDESFIRIVKGKGSKERHNPIHTHCLELIKRYMKQKKITSGWLFPSKYDKSNPMSREGIYKIVKKVAAESGVDPSIVSPHVFRHSFATHLLDNGCDVARVQEYLGHEDIATTRIYAQITKKNKMESFNKFHPLANN